MERLHELKNGTDIRGVSLDNKERPVNLTVNEVRLISKGFYEWLQNNKKEKNLKVAVGCDSRLSGEDFKKEVINTLLAYGAKVYDCKMATTPAMFMTTVMEDYNCDGAIMITASHLPYYYNGLKFFTKDGGVDKKDIDKIINLSVNNTLEESNDGRLEAKRLIDDYSKILVDKIRAAVNSKKNYNKPLEGLNIIVDAGNGSGGFFASKVLEELGASTKGSQFLNPDGNFPNHIPNPENKEAIESICQAVIKNKSDLGIIFDTDVDRAAIVDKYGNPINKDALIALISVIILNEYPGSAIVTDSITTDGLSRFIEKLGGKHHRFKRGYKNVINEGIRLNGENEECHLAIETSGHAAIKENYFLDDGAFLVSKILVYVAKLAEQGKDIGELIKELEEPLESIEYRINIDRENYRDFGEGILKDLEECIKNSNEFKLPEKNYEGVRVICDSPKHNGWFLLRLSLHEPLLALNIQSDVKNGVKNIEGFVKQFLEDYNLKF